MPPGLKTETDSSNSPQLKAISQTTNLWLPSATATCLEHVSERLNSDAQQDSRNTRQVADEVKGESRCAHVQLNICGYISKNTVKASTVIEDKLICSDENLIRYQFLCWNCQTTYQRVAEMIPTLSRLFVSSGPDCVTAPCLSLKASSHDVSVHECIHNHFCC